MAVASVGPGLDDGPIHTFLRDGANWIRQRDAIQPPQASEGFGKALALSGDGSTLVVGAPYFSNLQGAVYVYNRSPAGVWRRSSQKIVPRDAGTKSPVYFGLALTLSRDGKWLAVGGQGDASDTGATWMYAFDGTNWKSTGPKLVGTGATGASGQGECIALSADGSVLAVGGTGGFVKGAALWTFTRDKSGVYKQSAGPLRDSSGAFAQATTVALSADGKVMAAGIGGGFPGGALVFVYRGNKWTQQGPMLTGSGPRVSQMVQDQVALSADGTVLAVGAVDFSAENTGATYIFVYSRGKWLQVGKPLVGKGAIGGANQGRSIAMSASGRTVVCAGPEDNERQGAVWVFRCKKM